MWRVSTLITALSASVERVAQLPSAQQRLVIQMLDGVLAQSTRA